MTDPAMHWMLRGYPDWLFCVFVLAYALSTAGVVALSWPL